MTKKTKTNKTKIITLTDVIKQLTKKEQLNLMILYWTMLAKDSKKIDKLWNIW